MSLLASQIQWLADSINPEKSTRGEELLKRWKDFVPAVFPLFAHAPMGVHHEMFWDWVWAIEAGVRPQPYVAIWPRGGAKSSSAEMACVGLGARSVRKYIWYVCETQDQADKHVENIAEMLESSSVEEFFPSLSQREVGKFGNSRGWRRSRLRTASGLTIDSIGLDTARRGARVAESRPDVMIFDDIDGKHDSAATTRKKEEIITTSLLPAGSGDLAVIMVQNLIHPNSVFAKLADGRAEFLYGRIVDGPLPAIKGLTYELRDDGGYRITGGEVAWIGQDLETAQEQINEWGISAFLQEAQHEVAVPLGGVWDHIIFQHVNRDEMPDIVRGCVWVDPAVTSTDRSDSHAIQADAVAADGRIFRVYSWERITSPEDSIWRATVKAIQLGYDTVGVETDQGGDTWRAIFNNTVMQINEIATALHLIDKLGEFSEEMELDDQVKVKMAREKLDGAGVARVEQIRPYAKLLVEGHKRYPRFKSARAGSGYGSKIERNARMLADYERGRVYHVRGTHEALERALRRFPLTKPFDLTDAAFWSWNDIRGGSKGVYF